MILHVGSLHTAMYYKPHLSKNTLIWLASRGWPYNRQFQLLVHACRGRWEVRYHIADYAEKIKMVAV